MESVVSALDSAFDALTWAIARGAYWLSIALLILSALAALFMLVTVIGTQPARFRTADPAARPSDGIVLTGQLMGLMAIVGGIILTFRDTASWWQPLLAVVGGAALLALMVAYRRAGPGGQVRLSWFVWLALAVSAGTQNSMKK